ncbi:MAG TPA: c-type cytochrome [Methylovirgula sp.]|nr:c-type cytochrome [Methylovirgula sp.]
MAGAVLIAAFAAFCVCRRSTADTILDVSDRPWEACADCHGLEGVSATAHFPKLAGQKRAYIEKELRDFRSGARANDNGQMSGIADFSDRALELAADYFSRLPAPPSNGGRGKASARARAIVEAGRPGAGIVACRFCHDARADTAPWLEAQHAGYLAKELRDFKSGARTNDQIMSDIARRLSEEDIDQLAAYLEASPRIGAAP